MSDDDLATFATLCVLLHAMPGSKRTLRCDDPATEATGTVAPATPPGGERSGATVGFDSTPSKAQKRRKRTRQTAILKARPQTGLIGSHQESMHAPAASQMFQSEACAFPGDLPSRLDRIEHMVSYLFCKMNLEGEQCELLHVFQV